MDLSSLHTDQPLPDDDEFGRGGTEICDWCGGTAGHPTDWRWAQHRMDDDPNVDTDSQLFCTTDCRDAFLCRHPEYESVEN